MRPVEEAYREIIEFMLIRTPNRVVKVVILADKTQGLISVVDAIGHCDAFNICYRKKIHSNIPNLPSSRSNS